MQQTGLKRNTIDKFYTKPNVAEALVKIIATKLVLNDKDILVEPSAGNGSWIPAIQALGLRIKFLDLEPENPLVEKQDFLLWEQPQVGKLHIVGNPPFGRQSSMAIKFIKKACDIADSISFILPKSFKKESMRRHFGPNWHLIFELDLIENAFLVNQKDFHVECVFQIWEKKDIPRVDRVKPEPNGYQFVKLDKEKTNADVSFRRVGVNAGTFSKDLYKSIQSHYFIKFDHFDDELFSKLKELKFQENNTVGPKSISKQELVVVLNPLF